MLPRSVWKSFALCSALLAGTWAALFAQKPSGVDSSAEARARNAAALAFSPLAEKTEPTRRSDQPEEAVRLARASAAADVDEKSFDLVVIGGTGSGVLCAVRAAREGHSVLLVQHNDHLGGMMANGLMQWDALYGGPRSPLFSELLTNIEKHYVERFGRNSPDHQVVRYTHEHYPIGWVEPKVAEREFNRLVAGEKRITVLLSHYVQSVARAQETIRRVILCEYGATNAITVSGRVFVDATYEGDLLAAAGVAYRVGREARDEYNEPHAGKLFANVEGAPAPQDAVQGRLNIRPYNMRQGAIDPGSPFTADGAVQAYNYRFCVTRDPENRVMITEPPPGYRRDEYLHYGRKTIASHIGPNNKAHMNSPILPGENHAYAGASWPEREKIIARHRNFALGLIWFLQNDESVTEKARAQFREWGLPKDEFTDHGHIPYEMYVREARRLVGRHVFTEHDASPAHGLRRTPIFFDSIAVTDWYMDSHACTTESRSDFHYDGKLILTEETRPAQIPYRSLLPRECDNLLVPVCLSATHVAWGAIRLEPVWMQTGEAAGLAAALALKQQIPPVKLSSDALVRTLVERQHLISFFNDLRVDSKEAWVRAAQYFGTKGFFHDYDVRPEAPLREATAKLWVKAASQLRDGTLDSGALARAVAAAEQGSSALMSASDFQRLLPGSAAPDEVITRKQALEALWAELVSQVR